MLPPTLVSLHPCVVFPVGSGPRQNQPPTRKYRLRSRPSRGVGRMTSPETPCSHGLLILSLLLPYTYLLGHGRAVRQRELHDAVTVVLETPQVGRRRRVGVDFGGVEASARLVRVPGALVGATGRLPVFGVIGVSRSTPTLFLVAVSLVTRHEAIKQAKGTVYGASLF